MKTENLILVAAIAVAGYMVAKKTGMFAPAATATPYAPFYFNQQSAYTGQKIEGYDPGNPGAYVSVDELIGEAARGDTNDRYVPLFDQTLDGVLPKKGGFDMKAAYSPWM